MAIVFRVASILRIIWGVVHVFAGIMTMGLDTAAAVTGIADRVNPEALLNVQYPAAAGAVIRQHGFNLAWIGLTTIVGGVYVLRRNVVAIFVSALVGGLADVGYLIFIDLGRFNNFVPGTVMTLISASAI